VIAQALFFYLSRSWKNRLMVRIRRMREPRYLVGGIAGALYMYFYFFRALHRGAYGAGRIPMSGEHQALIQSIYALAFLVFILMMWIVPQHRAALTFTEAEASFLFAAPISRRDLINFKLLRSQAGILLSSFIMAFVGRFGSHHFYSGWVGWWIILATFNLHTLGASFTLTMLMDRGMSTARRRLMLLGAIVVVFGGIAFWVRQTLPPLPTVQANRNAFNELARYAGHALDAGPLPYILLPFKLLLAPFFAITPAAFLLALPAALGLLALHYIWVVRSDVAFEEASLEASRKLAERVAAIRSGNWQAARKNQKAVRSPFQLRASGTPAVALIWKNLIATSSMITVRFWMMLIWFAVVGGVICRSMLQDGVNLAVTSFIGMIAGMSLVFGPNLLRNDFRQDLLAMDMLKTLPLRGWQVVLGEILAPVTILTAAQWILLILALVCCPPQWAQYPLPIALRVACFFAAAAVLPTVNFANLVIRNAAVLIVPAWFQLGRDGPRGFENTGQQIILAVGQTLVLVVALLPPAAVFTGAFFLVFYVIGPASAFLVAGVLAAVILVIEATIAIRLLGGVFERFDLSKEMLTPA